MANWRVVTQESNGTTSHTSSIDTYEQMLEIADEQRALGKTLVIETRIEGWDNWIQVIEEETRAGK